MCIIFFGEKLMKKVTVSLYCDEIKECLLKLPFGANEKWTYIGVLIVPDSISTHLYSDLVNMRCLAEPPNQWKSCEVKCKWHSKNNTEIHYQGIDDSTKFKIASKWVDYWLNDRNNIYFYILGINLTKLNMQKFGPIGQQDRHSTIYNRFFRTAIKKALKTYFSQYDIIVIKDIFHDEGNVEHHDYFPWHSIFKLHSEEEKLYFSSNRIKFISSDHRMQPNNDMHAHFIQLIDIILGCFMNCLHANSKNKNKLGLAKQSFELVSRLVREPDNPNSRYNYFGRQMIDFFPREDLKRIDENSLMYKYRSLNQFYKKRMLAIEDYITGQTSIFNMLND